MSDFDPDDALEEADLRRKQAREQGRPTGEHEPYPEGWFDAFWESMDDPSEDDGTSAIRLIGELFASDGVWRDGDYLKGRMGAATHLSPDDQHLIRRIEQAVEAAREESDGD